MDVTDKIQLLVRKLPLDSQIEVLDFVEYLLNMIELEPTHAEERDWMGESLALAMYDMKDEERVTYTASDLKIVFL